ncbi:MAG: hypothetical protein OEM82_08300 [Acidobacteriota bacterium]|nr:hypothetical protein [Acidobacteriota bacterium]
MEQMFRAVLALPGRAEHDEDLFELQLYRALPDRQSKALLYAKTRRNRRLEQCLHCRVVRSTTRISLSYNFIGLCPIGNAKRCSTRKRDGTDV